MTKRKTLTIHGVEHDAFSDAQEEWETQGGFLSRLLLAVDPDELEQLRWETRNIERDELAAAAREKHNVGKGETLGNDNDGAPEEGVVTQQ